MPEYGSLREHRHYRALIQEYNLQDHILFGSRKKGPVQCLGSRGAAGENPMILPNRRVHVLGVIGIHLINEHRHYRAPIQEYNLQGSVA